MTIGHAQVATVSSAKDELSAVEAQLQQLQSKKEQALNRAAAAQRAGSAVLMALEASMAPLFAELASVRRAASGSYNVVASAEAGGDGTPGDEGATVDNAGGTSAPLNPTDAACAHFSEAAEAATAACAEVEATIQHLALDVTHYKQQTDRLEIEQRQREHEISRLTAELRDASESLGYERQRARHHEVLDGVGSPTGGWAGLGPMGLGKRTLEVRAEQRLREFSEKRGSSLTRDVTRLASDAAAHQAVITQLTRRLRRVRTAAQKKDRQLERATSHTSELNARLGVADDGGTAQALDCPGSDDDAVAAPAQAPNVPAKGRRKAKGSSSTGKLPQLSF